MTNKAKWITAGLASAVLWLGAGGCAQNQLAVQRDQLLKQNQQLQAQLAETKADLTAAQAQLTQAQQQQLAQAQQQAATSQPASGYTNVLPAFKSPAPSGRGVSIPAARRRVKHLARVGALHRFVLSSDLLFVSGSARLQPRADHHLLHLAYLLRTRYARRHIRIEGFTDPRPIHHPYKNNYALGLARARAVEQFLARHGIARSRMRTMSFGATHLVSRTDLALDRRVEVVVLR